MATLPLWGAASVTLVAICASVLARDWMEIYFSTREPAQDSFPIIVGAGTWLLLSGLLLMKRNEVVVRTVFAFSGVALLGERAWYLRGAWYVPLRHQDCTTSFETVVISIPRSAWRAGTIQHQLQLLGSVPKLARGVDARDFDSFEELVAPRRVSRPPNWLHDEALLMGHIAAMRSAASKTEWVLIFEDDAQLLPKFASAINETLCYHKDRDAVWLDTRTAVVYVGEGGRFTGSMAGMAYKSASLRVIARMMEYDSPERFAADRDLGFIVGVDTVMAWFCNHGLVRCGVSALVRESNIGTFRTKY